MIQLASLFSDGAVLQRDMQVPVWGKTTPRALVRAVCGTAESYGFSSASGAFTIYLPPMPAGGPVTLEVSTDSESVTVHDVLIGEVWLAGGQSNMQYRLNMDIAKSRPAEGERLLSRIQEEEFVNSIRDPESVRFLNIPYVARGAEEDSFSGTWQKMTKENAPEFSAVAAWFAKKVQETLHIPVGIISSNVGGTIAETWTSRNGLMQNPETAAMLREMDSYSRLADAWGTCRSYDIQLKERGIGDNSNQGFEQGWASPEWDDASWKDMQIPGSWIKQHISGHGVLWARCSVNIPENWTGKKLILHIRAVDKRDTAYFNGTEIGHTGSGYDTQFWDDRRNYDISPDLVKASRAVIAIRACSFMYDGSISDVELENAETGEKLPLNGTWEACAEKDFGIIGLGAEGQKFARSNMNLPTTLFNGMIRPLIPYAMRGVIWYQGESNANTKPDAETYYAKLRCLINDWRYQWAQGDFPFIQMILANYREPKTFCMDDAWPTLREAQIRLCSDTPSVYAASAIDIGDALDIHPMNKKDAGYRMARMALAKVYHLSGIVPAGPRFRKHTMEGNTVLLEFENGEGLAFRGGCAKGFVMTDAGGYLCQPESIVIENNTVRICCKAGMFPTKLYYSWADNPDGNLENGAGLPADPFRVQL